MLSRTQVCKQYAQNEKTDDDDDKSEGTDVEVNNALPISGRDLILHSKLLDTTHIAANSPHEYAVQSKRIIGSLITACCNDDYVLRR